MGLERFNRTTVKRVPRPGDFAESSCVSANKNPNAVRTRLGSNLPNIQPANTISSFKFDKQSNKKTGIKK
jgi:hypothetical protein